MSGTCFWKADDESHRPGGDRGFYGPNCSATQWLRMVRSLLPGKPRKASPEEAGTKGSLLFLAAYGNLEQEAGPQKENRASDVSRLCFRSRPLGRLFAPNRGQDACRPVLYPKFRGAFTSSTPSNRGPTNHDECSLAVDDLQFFERG